MKTLRTIIPALICSAIAVILLSTALILNEGSLAFGAVTFGTMSYIIGELEQ
jgi:hypothetical protein